MSESAGGRPAQLRIVDDVRAEIASGKLTPGAKLASTRELMARYEVSNQTVQRAMSILRSEGVVESRPGSGIFVRAVRELLDRRPLRDEDDPHRRGDVLRSDAWVGPAPDDVAASLALGPLEDAIARRTVLAVNAEPVEIVTSYYPPGVAGLPRLEELTPDWDGSLAELRRRRLDVQVAAERVQTRLPTPSEAGTLRLAPGVAVFRLVRSLISGSGSAVEVQVTVMAGDRYQLLYELPH